jgi:germination protein M
MLKNGIKKRIFLIISSIFIILIIYLFPTKKEDTNYEEKKNKTKDVIIYLLDEKKFVSRVSVYMKENELEKKIKEMIEYITIDSKNSSYIKEGFKPIIPKNTKLLSISIDNNLVKLNFSKELLTIDEDNEDKMISAIIYSLTSLDGIKEISIYVEGNLLTKLPNSGKSLPSILNRSYGINKVYDLTKIKGSTKTTIYYLSKYKNYYYYVPVTMVNNDEKEKIEVIIEEMASKSVYQTSLISYLKEAKEVSYELDDDKLNINFTKNLFDSLNKNNLVESVIYSINLSIKENYNIKEINYNIDDYSYRNYNI